MPFRFDYLEVLFSMKEIFLNDDECLDHVNENIDLIQKKDGLRFGTDALLLASFVREQKHARAADLGCGTGIISLLLLARDKCKSIHAIDVQRDFCTLANRNAELNGLESRMFAKCADVRELNASMLGGELDYIVCNPPYMLSTSGKANLSDAKNIARHEVFGGISDFAETAAKILKFGGLFYLVYRPDRMCDLISALRENSLEPKRITMVYPDTESIPSMMLVEAKLGGAPGCTLTRPLIVYREGKRITPRKFTSDMQSVYDTGILFN